MRGDAGGGVNETPWSELMRTRDANECGGVHLPALISRGLYGGELGNCTCVAWCTRDEFRTNTEYSASRRTQPAARNCQKGALNNHNCATYCNNIRCPANKFLQLCYCATIRWCMRALACTYVCAICFIVLRFECIRAPARGCC